MPPLRLSARGRVAGRLSFASILNEDNRLVSTVIDEEEEEPLDDHKPFKSHAFRLVQDAMKETPVKQEIKMEWENHADENSSHVHGAEDQTSGSPQSVITTRRHVRTITTAGHIKDSSDVDPESPDSNSLTGSLHQGLHQRGSEQHEQQRVYQEEQQQSHQTQSHYIQIPHPGVDDQQRTTDQQRVVYAPGNSQQVHVEVSEAPETIILTVKEPPR